MRFSKTFLVGAAGFGIVWILNRLLAATDIQLGNSSIHAIYLALAFFSIYLPEPKRRRAPRSGGKTEYVLNGMGQSTGKVFRESDYPEYSELECNADGRIFSDPTGKILCTQFAVQKPDNSGSSRLRMAALCLICVMVSIMLEYAIPLMGDGGFRLFLRRIGKQFAYLDPTGPIYIIRMNLRFLARSLSEIRPELDLGACLEIIKDNLENLSILQFK